MKLIEKIKSFFKKEIKAPNVAGDRPVTVSNPNGVIKIGTKLTVEEGYVAVICTKGKVCDIFIKGEYELTPGIMQKANRIRKLSIPNKKGKYKKDFKGFIYYVNLKQFDDKFSSYNGVIVKEKKLFTSVVGINGEFSYKIQNPKKLMEMLTMEYYNVSGELPNEKLRLLAGQYTDKFVQGKRLKFSYFYNNNKAVSEGLCDYMKKQFLSVGIELIDIKIDSFEFSKKLLKQIESGKLFVKDVATVYEEKENKEQALKDIVENQQDQISFDVTNKENENNEVDTTRNESQQEDAHKDDGEKQQEDSQNNILDDNGQINTNLSNNVLKSEEYENDLFENTYNELNDIQSQYEYDGKSTNEDGQSKGFEEAEQVVENDEDGVVTADVIKIKKCISCGASNSGDSEKCFNCGASFVRKCEKCGASLKDDEYVCPKCGSIVI